MPRGRLVDAGDPAGDDLHDVGALLGQFGDDDRVLGAEGHARVVECADEPLAGAVAQGGAVQRFAVANTGIGEYVARQLAGRGVTVLVGSRDPDRGRAAVETMRADGLEVRLQVLDVTDPASIAAAAAEVQEAFGRLDVLVNNAAVSSGDAATSEVTLENLRRTYETNVFGVTAVTNAFLPLLHKSVAPRIVNVSSTTGSVTAYENGMLPETLNNAAYQSSKAALNMLTVLYAKELQGSGILVNAVSPGYRATGLNPNSRTPGAGDPAGGAEIVVHAATFPDDGPTGTFWNDTFEQLA